MRDTHSLGVQFAEEIGKPGLVDIQPKMDEFIFHVEPVGQHDPRVLIDLAIQESKVRRGAVGLQDLAIQESKALARKPDYGCAMVYALSYGGCLSRATALPSGRRRYSVPDGEGIQRRFDPWLQKKLQNLRRHVKMAVEAVEGVDAGIGEAPL